MSNQDTINGVEQAIVHRPATKAKYAMDSIAEDMVNWVKDNHVQLGGWQHVSHNLHNSINATKAKWYSDFHPTEGFMLAEKILIAVIHAGPIYAIYVEHTPNHWVLSAVMNEYRNTFLSLMKERIEAQG